MALRENSRVDTIYATVRDRICLGIYKPGDVLHEAELGQEFQVSRTPIRQVLQRLAYEKLATVRSGVGTIVGGPGESDVEICIRVRSQILMIVADMNLTVGRPEDADAFDALMFRGSRIRKQPQEDRVWSLMRDLHAFCNQLIAMDLLQNDDEMLFYRAAPSIVAAIRRDPQRAVAMLEAELDELAPFVDRGDLSDFFRARAKTMLSYRDLTLVPTG